MNNIHNYESRFWEIIKRERLVDFSQFHKSGFFDEVPLFSRQTDLEFLAALGRDRANAVLLTFALKYFTSVVSYEVHRTAFFAAITVWSSSESDPLIPNLFVWSGQIRRLEKALVLHKAATPFGKRIRGLVSKLGLRRRFSTLEDTSTMPDMQRVFISQSIRPYPSFVPLSRFRKAFNPAK